MKRRCLNFEVIPVYQPDPERCAQAAVELVQERTARLATEARAKGHASAAPTLPAAEQEALERAS